VFVQSQSACVDPQVTRSYCGSAAAPCSLNEVCVGGACVPLANYTLLAGINVTGMQVDGTDVVYSDASAGTINKLPVAGGNPTVLATDATSPTIALDGQSAYYDAGGATVKSVSKAGGAPQVVSTGSGSIGELLVDGTSVYWVEDSARVRAAPKAGGASTVLYDQTGVGYLGLLRQNSTTVFVVNKVILSQAMGNFNQTLVEMPKAGGSPTLVPVVTNGGGLPQNPGIDYLGVDDAYYYWGPFALRDRGFVAESLATQGSTIDIWFAALDSSPGQVPVVFDGGYIFLLQGGIRKLAKCQNQHAPLVLDVPAKLLAASNGYLYWSDGGMIGRVAE
jgi:hypothetical protein